MAQCEQCKVELLDGKESCPACGASVLPEIDELLGREVLGRYRIVRMLAEGGMGRVYLAEQSVGTVVRRVAVKVLRRQLGNDRQLVSRFSREAETLVRLTHPNTVQLFDFGTLPDGTLALVMEYVEGHSLARELERGALTPARVERLMAQACGALQEAHAHGIVHRDLKPDNMLIAERVGHGDFIKVLDFGIAKVSSEQEAAGGTKLTQQGMIIGTPPYMSPEQFSGDAVDARSDIYSLGVIAYEMLTAKLPFAAKTPWEWASRHLTAQPDALPLSPSAGLLPRHARAIRDALAKRPEDRPQTVADFLARFSSDAAPASSSAGTSSSSSATSSPPATGSSGGPPTESSGTPSETLSTHLRGRWSRPVMFGLLAGVAVLLGLLGLVASRGSKQLPKGPPALALRSAGPSEAPRVVVADSMPSGAALPVELPGIVQSARPHRESSAAGDPAASAHAHRATHTHGARQRQEPSPGVQTSAPEPVPAPAEAPPLAPLAAALPVAPVAVQGPLRMEPPKRVEPAKPAASAAVSPLRRAPEVPDDLAQRVRQIQSAAATRVETAVGLFQAAASRYGAHPALSPARVDLAKAGESRIRELIGNDRCAQAQALYRALRAIDAGAKAKDAFRASCPAPA